MLAQPAGPSGAEKDGVYVTLTNEVWQVAVKDIPVLKSQIDSILSLLGNNDEKGEADIVK